MKKTVVAIGVFDGVHLGHQKILTEAVKIARRFGTQAVAVTFDPHPLSVIGAKNAPPSVISLAHRKRLIYSTGIDRCIVFNFTKRFAGISAYRFLKDIVVKRLNAGWVVVGNNFHFGRARYGDPGFLRRQARRLGFIVKEIKPLKYKGTAISSSLIRKLIQKGRLDFAQRLLGRPATVLGTVVKGSRRGQTIGFPTANINPHHEVVPPSGVYAVRVKLGQKEYGGVLNIGTRPTFYDRAGHDQEPTIEVHIFNFSKRVYGEAAEVIFLKRLRPEREFIDKKALAEQIKRDVKKAKEAICTYV